MMNGKPTVSLFELGSALGTVAGLEFVESLTAPVEGATFRIAGFFDAPEVEAIKNYLRDLDVSIESFKNDASQNVTRPTFLQSLNEWIFGWKKFLGSHQTTTQIMLAGRDATMTQAKEYGQKLDGWRNAYRLETGKAPEGQTPSTPKDPEPTFSVSTKMLIGIGVLTALGLAGYATYRYVKKMREDTLRAEGFARGYAERLIAGGFGGGTGRGLPSGEGHAILADGE
jgi:hypothetical protein